MAEQSDVEKNNQPQDDFPAYDAEAIETKWQRIWDKEGLYKTEEDPTRPKVSVSFGRSSYGARAQLHHR